MSLQEEEAAPRFEHLAVPRFEHHVYCDQVINRTQERPEGRSWFHSLRTQPWLSLSNVWGEAQVSEKPMFFSMQKE